MLSTLFFYPTVLWPLHSCKVCPFTAVFTMLHSTRNTHNGKYRAGTAGGEWSEPPCLLLYIIMWPMKVWWLQFSSSWNTYDILWLMHAVHIVHAYTVVIEHCSCLRFQFKSRAIIELVTGAGKYECVLFKSSRNVAQQMITDIQNFNLRWKGGMVASTHPYPITIYHKATFLCARQIYANLSNWASLQIFLLLYA